MCNEDGDHAGVPHARRRAPAPSSRRARSTARDTGRCVADDISRRQPRRRDVVVQRRRRCSRRRTQRQRRRASPASHELPHLVGRRRDARAARTARRSASTAAARSLQRAAACASNNGTKSTPTLTADLLGDWREEIIWRESNSSALRLYTTTDVTTRRIYTLMHDPQYRVAVSWQNVAYNQPPHPSFHIGSGMAAPPRPNITVR